MKAELIKHNNDDLSAANIARVSFDKWNDGLDVGKDTGLINYLAKNMHISPFFHQRFTFKAQVYLYNVRDPELLMGAVWDDDHFRTSFYGWVRLIEAGLVKNSEGITNKLISLMPISAAAFGMEQQNEYVYLFGVRKDIIRPMDETVKVGNTRFIDHTIRVTAPIFVMEQLFTHKMFAKNRISRRYVSDSPTFWIPDFWRSKPEGSIKQGSGNIHEDTHHYAMAYDAHIERSKGLYNGMIMAGVAPEMARTWLPVSMETSVILTGSEHHFKQMLALRKDGHAQLEIQEMASMIEEVLPW